MKTFFLIAATYLLTCTSIFADGAPDPRAKEIDWSDKSIIILPVGDNIQIIFHTGGTAGKRLIKTEVESFSDYSFVTLTYQIVQNFEESYKHMEPIPVTWTIPKSQYEKLRQDRKFYILRKDDIFLDTAEIKEIQSNWKTHP